MSFLGLAMKRLRWTLRLRTLMLGIALIALLLAAWLARRRDDYQMWQRFYANQERQFLKRGDPANATLHAMQKRRYEEGVWQPWLDITPDPTYADFHPGGVNYEKSRPEIERFRRGGEK